MQFNMPPPFINESNNVFPFERKSMNESNASEFDFFRLLANAAFDCL